MLGNSFFWQTSYLVRVILNSRTNDILTKRIRDEAQAQAQRWLIINHGICHVTESKICWSMAHRVSCTIKLTHFVFSIYVYHTVIWISNSFRPTKIISTLIFMHTPLFAAFILIFSLDLIWVLFLFILLSWWIYLVWLQIHKGRFIQLFWVLLSRDESVGINTQKASGTFCLVMSWLHSVTSCQYFILKYLKRG